MSAGEKKPAESDAPNQDRADAPTIIEHRETCRRDGEDRRLYNLLEERNNVDTIKHRPTADVVADILGLNPKESQQFLDALHSQNPVVVDGAKSALRIAYPEDSNKMALMEYAKAQALDRTTESVTRLWAEHKSVMSGESKAGCRHLEHIQTDLEKQLAEIAASLDKRIALIEQKVVIYAAIALFILTPITSALTAAIFAYMSKK
jgi:hypothetical protein